MIQRLPIGDYQWVSESMIEQNFNTPDYQKNVSTILNLEDDSDLGYIFECDLHYPQEIHDKHNCYPFLPENQNIPGIVKNKKLLLTLNDKKNYKIHYKMLKLALEQGIVLKKVKRILQFKQIAWLKPYIELNTKHRTQAQNEFEKNFFKLMNNSVYGKTMENLRLRSDYRIINTWEGRVGGRSLIARPNFKRLNIIDEDLVVIEMHRTHILMNKPIIVGMSILDISKVTMFSYWYKYFLPKYGKNVQMVYTDTDSFLLELTTPDAYADIRNDPDTFDTSDYPENNIYGIKRLNKKVIGLLKDEMASTIITEVVALRSKLYAVRTLGKIDKIKKAKGVKKNVLKNTITFDDYYNCIKNKCVEVRRQYTIRSKNHNVYTISTNKVSLSPTDDKRYFIEPEKINSLAWGHWRINSEQMVREDSTQHMMEIAE